jgi:CHAT domain-containing protein
MADRIRLELIVLSACQTGVAESLGGNEFAGLTQAFHVAGVRCVVASLWKVDDPVTALLMARFYANWMAGSDLARALSEAMDITNPAAATGDTTERARRDIGAPHPSAEPPPTTYYWDSFVISGDWSTSAITLPAQRSAATRHR